MAHINYEKPLRSPMGSPLTQSLTRLGLNNLSSDWYRSLFPQGLLPINEWLNRILPAPRNQSISLPRSISQAMPPDH